MRGCDILGQDVMREISTRAALGPEISFGIGFGLTHVLSECPLSALVCHLVHVIWCKAKA